MPGPTIRFPIEAAHVLMFARAIGASDETAIPPTFAIAGAHFDPAYERRPRARVPWLGSGAEPMGPREAAGQPGGEGGGFHAEQRFVYHRALRVGDVLFGETRPGARWHKQGRRGGALAFQESVTEYRDADGAPVVTLHAVDVATARRVGREAAPPSRESGAAPPAGGPGAVQEETLVEDLKRTQIVMYAGASGDFHPMHSDETYARAMGMPGVFAHGMLTMGLASRALLRAVDAGRLVDYGARFLRTVWPGDTLVARVARGEVGARGARRLARYSLAVRNQRGDPVLEGEAHALLDAG